MRHDSGYRSDAEGKIGGTAGGTRPAAPDLHKQTNGELRDDGQTDARFDLPAQFGGRSDRRMAERAEAQWRAALPVTRAALMPALRTVDTGPASEFAAHALLLDVRRGDRVEVVHAGAAIAAMFGITAGYLANAGEGGLAALLIDGCELMRLWHAVVPVDAAIGGTDSACLLTRGVLLPLADDEGSFSYVHAVLNWKQLLDRSARTSLRREFVAAVRESVPLSYGFPGFGTSNR